MKTVIYLYMDDKDKEALRQKAVLNGTNLTTYCRMVLLKDLKEHKND
jgi:predicted DNA binding CopG/RHH family protein